jgi:hypothetical protein
MSRPLLPALLLAAALAAQSPLTTTFAHNAACLPGGAVYFDLHVFAPPVTLTRFDLNLSGSGVVELWTIGGSRAGNQTQPGNWTLHAVAPVVSASPGGPTPVAIPPLELGLGTRGFAVRAVGLVQFSTIGTGSGTVASTAHMTMNAGEETFALFTPPVMSPRVPNVAVHYLVGDHVAMPPHTANASTGSRGFRFVAAADFVIRQLALPLNAYQPGDTASYLVRVNGAAVWRHVGAGTNPVDAGVLVRSGETVDVLGNWTPPVPGPGSAHVSTAPSLPWPTVIAGVNHVCQPVGWSWDVGDPAWTPNGATGSFLAPPAAPAFGRVLMTTVPTSRQATSVAVGEGCNTVSGSCYQQLPSASFDLSNSALTFTPQTGGGYLVTRTGALRPVGATGPVQSLALGPDAEVTVPFPVGFFPGWAAMTICSNGYVSRDPGNGTSGTPNVAHLLAAPQPAFWCWHDFDPSGPGGGVRVEQSPAVAVVTWDGVPDQNGATPGSSTMQFQLWATGAVTIAWGAMSPAGGAYLVGYSPGGPSPDAGPTDLSALPASGLTLPAVEAWPTTLATVTRPILGTDWRLDVTNVPANSVLGVDVLGRYDAGIVDLAAIGMPGCSLFCTLDVLEAWAITGPVHQRSLFIPNTTALINERVHAVSVVFTPGNAFGAVTTNSIRAYVGDM